MNGLRFGSEVKMLRTNAGIGSKELSRMIGKAVTYVSQLELGKIKSPDYNACYKILEAVGFPKQHIDRHLESFGILSPELEEHWLNANAEYAQAQEAEIEANPDAYFEKWRQWYDEDQISDLKEATTDLHKMLDVFIDRDLSRSQVVIGNMENMLASKQNFEFLCALFTMNLASIPVEKRTDFLESIRNWLSTE